DGDGPTRGGERAAQDRPQRGSRGLLHGWHHGLAPPPPAPPRGGGGRVRGAARIDGVAGAVGYYGGGIADTATEQPRCPVLLHFGETDASIPPEHWDKVRAAHPQLPGRIYPGRGHRICF